MEQDNRQDSDQQDGWRERRVDRRQPAGVDATVSFLVRDLELKGQLVNLSVSGARFAASGPCPRGAGHLVDIVFHLSGRLFHLTAVVQWNDGARLGLQFEPLPDRRRQQLQETMVLEAIRLRSKQEAQMDAAMDDGTWTETGYPSPDSPPATEPMAALTGSEGWRERRSSHRAAIDLPAIIYLVNSGVKMNGRIENLCVGGCRIQTDHRLQAGIYTRVEAGFYHLGQPFRVGGVIQVLHAPNEVGIRFLDVSERIGLKLADLMSQIEADGRASDEGTGTRE